MKTRFGFVSNSSSSSFLVMYNDLSDFDELKQICSAELEKEFGVFFGDVKDCPVKDAMYFLSSLYGSILREYALDSIFTHTVTPFLRLEIQNTNDTCIP